MATQRFFKINFHPNPWGFMIQFDEHIFSNGWKPPTSYLLNNLRGTHCVAQNCAGWQGDLLPSSTVDVSLEECPGWLVWGDTLIPDMGSYIAKI